MNKAEGCGPCGGGCTFDHEFKWLNFNVSESFVFVILEGLSLRIRFPSSLETAINAENPLIVANDVDGSDVSIYLSSSPQQFCPGGRDVDIDAILRHIDEAEKFIHVSYSFKSHYTME